MPEKPTNENLQFPRRPGENRNPSCAPNKLPISGLYAEFARKTLPDELRLELHLAEGANYGNALARGLFDAAIKGSIPAAREIREAIEGKANQRPKPVGAESFEVIVTYEQPPLSQMLPADSSDAPHE